ncbi:M1 family metallopeptidase [Mucilaginibacter ginkgonis]|uniref:M1 family peptidase n=1 Tax=Mucilaginibacter ginkgonis TaxID=2682091 RepID=A0A6I4I0Q8_9SPHI|nr:M1 family metallopeptidase [Mucilaginibacter ginkgonis]QQL49705.1 M1 family peptidase [Mucilaginibacter ginkgonis]
MKKFYIFFLALTAAGSVLAQPNNNPKSNHGNKFEQLGTMLSTPNEYRSASGAPGPKYWQQKADYDITATLDDDKQRLDGSETIDYYNNSPDPLTYLWIQLDENQHKKDGESAKFDESRMKDKMTLRELQGIMGHNLDLGDHIVSVKDAQGNALDYTINETMMRIEMPHTLMPGERFKFKIVWWYNISDRLTIGGRGGYEYFPEDKNYLYTMAQWYPRMAVYSDFQGWQNKQFTGRGEFALTFGDFKVSLNVPADHFVGGTGQCSNYAQTLTGAQLKRWEQAQTAKEPVEIVTLAEVKKQMQGHATARKVWQFHAENVRDFAWVSSRRVVWDAMSTQIDGGKKVMAMSIYGPEAYPLYRRYSTKLVAHTLKVYSKHTFPYPYPCATSVEASNGMEYPMICFNNGRADKDGTYSEAVKYAMTGVIIHEVGHNFFPMIVNSDERQWTWMDEGLNTFCQFLAEQEWDNHYPSQRGPAYKIVDYMKLPPNELEPIMTNSENIVRFGPNAYSKPATALNILRETVMGRKLFDYSFKTYSHRWAFKHPTPEDFFRTMEDASAVDLDWFWRGWFYGIDPVDISLDSVKYYRMNTKNPEVENTYDRAQFDRNLDNISSKRNKDEGIKFAVEADTSLKDFYGKWDRFAATPLTKQSYQAMFDALTPAERAMYQSKNYFYQLSLSNKGGCVMPLIIEWTYADGTKEVERISAYIWRKNESNITKVFAKSKEVKNIKIDPYRETADIDENNNSWPREYAPSRFELFKSQEGIRGASSGTNPMKESMKKP